MRLAPMPAHAHLAGRAREEPALEVAGLLRDYLDAVEARVWLGFIVNTSALAYRP